MEILGYKKLKGNIENLDTEKDYKGATKAWSCMVLVVLVTNTKTLSFAQFMPKF